MIPIWCWPIVALACLLILAEWDCYRINRRRDKNRGAIEAERMARENAAPLGNAERLW